MFIVWETGRTSSLLISHNHPPQTNVEIFSSFLNQISKPYSRVVQRVQPLLLRGKAPLGSPCSSPSLLLAQYNLLDGRRQVPAYCVTILPSNSSCIMGCRADQCKLSPHIILVLQKPLVVHKTFGWGIIMVSNNRAELFQSHTRRARTDNKRLRTEIMFPWRPHWLPSWT